MTIRHHVFLSYSREDTAMMQRVKCDLLVESIAVWTDEGIWPGVPSWKWEIEHAIEDAHCVVVLLSPSAKQSAWVRRELDYAETQGVPIIPVVVRGTDSESIPFSLVGSQYIDLRSNYEAGLARLLPAVSATREPEPLPLPVLVPVAEEPTPIFSVIAPLPEPEPAPLLERIDEASLTPVSRNRDWMPVIRTIQGIDMVLVPPGCFQMGDTKAEFAHPVHEQHFPAPYWISLYPITNAQYHEAVHQGRCMPPAYAGDSYFNDPQQPVVGLSWFDAMCFAEWKGMRLPTEAEWEYAARGPDGLLWPWGSTFDPDHIIYDGNTDGRPAPAIGRFTGASWVGARDMSGNVWEWTSTIYDPENYPYPYWSGDGREELTRADISRVVRGGSWQSLPDWTRATVRQGDDPITGDESLGFRLVYDPALP